MKYRKFGRTGWEVSEIGFGAWAIGGNWGTVSEADAEAALRTSLDAGVNFVDTADVYGGGRSERIIAKVLKERSERIYVATKAGRGLNPHIAEGYNQTNLNAFVDKSLANLGVGCIDLLQLHCPPTDVYYQPEVFDALDDMVRAGKILYYGVSVERVEEALKAIEYENVASVQIIFNMFRQRPADLFFDRARTQKAAIISRVPLASGLLTGKMSSSSEFSADDHRNFNRNGQAFDVGETFAGVDFESGLDAVEDLRSLCPDATTMAQFALKWILEFGAVSTVIPGAKNADQARDNTAASDLPGLLPQTLHQVDNIYQKTVKPQVHHRW